MKQMSDNLTSQKTWFLLHEPKFNVLINRVVGVEERVAISVIMTNMAGHLVRY